MSTWKRNIEIFSYEILWRASETALKMTDVEDERIRPDHLCLNAILTGFLAFEGFLNFVGEEIAEDEWMDERQFFSGPEFKGVVGKVEYLFTLFPEKDLRKGEEPFQTFRRIKEVRDLLAHNRVKRYEEVSDSKNSSFEMHWDDFDTPEKVKPALERLKEFAEVIRVEAVKLLKEDYQQSHLHFPAFTGPIGHSEGRTID